MKCPNCSGDLIKKPEYAEGIWQCVLCGVVWFIIKVREAKKERAA